MANTAQGWIIVDQASPGLKPSVWVEWNEQDGRKQLYMKARGEAGCAEAVEWWEKRLAQTIILEASLRGCYRVYTKT